MAKRVFCVLVVVAIMIAVVPVSLSTAEIDREGKIALVQRFGEELWINLRFDTLGEYVAEDFVAHFWGSPDQDLETYLEETVKVANATFPDWGMRSNFFLVDGDYVIVDDNWGGTFTNEIWGFAPTGKEVRVNGVEIFRIENDKIAEAWILFDTLSYMQQLGAFPVEGEAVPDEPWDIALGESDLTPEEIKAFMVNQVELAAKHDMETSFSNCTEDAIVHDQDGDMTRDEAKQVMIGVQAAWPDHHLADVMYFAEGDLGIAVYTLVFAEDEVMFGGVTVDRFEDGKIAEEWWLYDAATFIEQTTPAS